MEPILFYGVPEGCSFGSIVALEWLGKPYRLCRIQMPEVVSGDDYKRINRVGETPSFMTETNEVISESLAILNHMVQRESIRGLGFTQGSAKFNRLNQTLAFLNTSFFGSFSPLWHALEQGSEGAEKEALTAFGREKVEKAHVDLETMLDGRDWLLGDYRTLADAYFIGTARWADFHKAAVRNNYPGLQRLFDKLEADPAVSFAHAVEHQGPANSAGGFVGHVSLEEALQRLR